MLKTILLLDGTDVMDFNADYIPSRLLALRPCLAQFVKSYLDSTPLATIGAVVMRDGVSHRIAALTNSSSTVLEALESKYFLFRGSGALSLENGLRNAFVELTELSAPPPQAAAKRKRKGPTAQKNRVMKASLRIIVITASITVVDGCEVMAFFPLLQHKKVQVDLVSLVGAVHVMTQLTEATGGTFVCPENFEALQRGLRSLVQQTKPHAIPPHLVSGVKRERPDEVDECDLVPIGFPVRRVEEKGETSNASRSVASLMCPNCQQPQVSVPCVCSGCDLLIGCLPFSHVSYVRRNKGVPPTTPVINTPRFGEGASLTCALCHATRRVSPDSGNIVSTFGFVECMACRKMRCGVCNEYVQESLGLCPSCIG